MGILRNAKFLRIYRHFLFTLINTDKLQITPGRQMLYAS
jgi:hypothetical protein